MLNRFIAALAALVVLTGCTPTVTIPAGETPSNTESAAVVAARSAISALITSIDTAQSGTTGQTGGQSAAAAPQTEANCPTVTFSQQQSGVQMLSVTLGFGSGCTLNSVNGFECSGSATGSYDPASALITLTFDQLTCADQGLAGSVTLGFTRRNSTVTLAGDFDLTWADGSQSTQAEGAGAATFDATARHTTIETFSGNAARDGQSYALSLDGIRVSYAAWGNFVPFSGEMTVSAGTIRTISIRFNANSPVTGEIEVRYAGGDYQSANLSDF